MYRIEVDWSDLRIIIITPYLNQIRNDSSSKSQLLCGSLNWFRKLVGNPFSQRRTQRLSSERNAQAVAWLLAPAPWGKAIKSKSAASVHIFNLRLGPLLTCWSLPSRLPEPTEQSHRIFKGKPHTYPPISSNLISEEQYVTLWAYKIPRNVAWPLGSCVVRILKLFKRTVINFYLKLFDWGARVSSEILTRFSCYNGTKWAVSFLLFMRWATTQIDAE